LNASTKKISNVSRNIYIPTLSSISSQKGLAKQPQPLAQWPGVGMQDSKSAIYHQIMQGRIGKAVKQQSAGLQQVHSGGMLLKPEVFGKSQLELK
jgi:hypothetical protein